jgi:hypothetical protein
MISSKNRRRNEKVEYVVVERDDLSGDEQRNNATPTPTIDQILSRSYMRRGQPTATTSEDDSDNEDEYQTTSTTATPSSGGPPPV